MPCHQALAAFFSSSALAQLCRALLTRALVLSPAELTEYEDDPEGFVHEESVARETEGLRKCVERCLLCLPPKPKPKAQPKPPPKPDPDPDPSPNPDPDQVRRALPANTRRHRRVPAAGAAMVVGLPYPPTLTLTLTLTLTVTLTPTPTLTLTLTRCSRRCSACAARPLLRGCR